MTKMESEERMQKDMQLAELSILYGKTEAWSRQMSLLAGDPILYLEDYRHVPEEIWSRKDDTHLHPSFCGEDLAPFQVYYREGSTPASPDFKKESPPARLCAGIGTYRTKREGEIYLCALLDASTGRTAAYSFGVYRNAELVGKALEIFSCLYQTAEGPISLLTSRNPLYLGAVYQEVMSSHPSFVPVMTEKGTRGGVSAVSTFFSQLMRRKKGFQFEDWQDAVDWLTLDILKQNLKLQEKAGVKR